MRSDQVLLDRAIQTFPDATCAGQQLLYLRLALRRLEERAVLDVVLEAIAQGRAHLGPYDLLWVAFQPDIHAMGYELPSGYALGSQNFGTLAQRSSSEWRTTPAAEIIGRIRRNVVLKISWVDGAEPSREVDAYNLLLSEPHVSDPRNPVLKETRILDLLSSSKSTVVAKLLVMPRLRELSSLDLRVRISRFDCVRQMLHSLVFLHSLGLSHGDIHPSNVVTTRFPPFKVYFIDFDLSRRFDTAAADRRRRVKWEGGKIAPPEVNEDDPHAEYDPFPVDVYALAVTWLVLDRHLFDEDMDILRYCIRHEDPSPEGRPTAEASLTAFEGLYDLLPWRPLLAPARPLRIWWVPTRRLYFCKEIWLYLRDLVFLAFRGSRGRKGLKAPPIPDDTPDHTAN